MNATTTSYLDDATVRYLRELEPDETPTGAGLRAFIDADGWGTTVADVSDDALADRVDAALAKVEAFVQGAPATMTYGDEAPDGRELVITPEGVAAMLARMGGDELTAVVRALSRDPKAADARELVAGEHRRRRGVPEPDAADAVASTLWARIGAASDATGDALVYLEANQSAIEQRVFVPTYNLLTRAAGELADAQGRVSADA